MPYGNMPADVGTGDTYGPLNYLLYVPFVLMFGYSGEWDFLPGRPRPHRLRLRGWAPWRCS